MTVDFKKLDFTDLPSFTQILSRHPQRICCFTPQALFVWRQVYQYAWSQLTPETFLISFQTLEDEDERSFFQPVGPLEPPDQRRLISFFRSLGYPARIFNVGEEFIRKNTDFLENFDVQKEDGLVNYLYNTKDLALLHGAFYEKKRNMIAAARKLYSWSVHPLTSENYQECSEALSRWSDLHDEEDLYRDKEILAANEAISNFPGLSYQGVLIKVEGKAAAFSLFAKLNPETAGINFMKADRRYKGLSEIIHHETAKAIDAAGFALINLEEDWDIPGLRKNKNSYRPSELIPSYILELKV